VVLEQPVSGEVSELFALAVFIRGGAYICVDGDARDVEVVVDSAGQSLGGGADDARDVATGVDDRVPRSAFEGREVPFAIAAELLGLGEELGVRLPAVEEGDLVPARQGRFDCRAAEELRSAEDEELHRSNATCGFLTGAARKQYGAPREAAPAERSRGLRPLLRQR